MTSASAAGEWQAAGMQEKASALQYPALLDMSSCCCRCHAANANSCICKREQGIVHSDHEGHSGHSQPCLPPAAASAGQPRRPCMYCSPARAHRVHFSLLFANL